jgi:hypothetical protein
MRQSQLDFICEQGFHPSAANDELYSALMFQPRLITVVAALGVGLQSPWLFLATSAVLLFSTVAPSHSVFDAIYNHVVAYPRSRRPLGVAHPPRRFAQGLAGAVALAIGVALAVEVSVVAWVLETVLVIAALRAVFGDFCLGAHVYYVLRRLTSGQPLPCGSR